MSISSKIIVQKLHFDLRFRIVTVLLLIFTVDPPQIVHAFQSETLQPGPPVHLMCVASGNPTPEITWELDGKKLTSRERIQVGQYLKMNGNGNVVSHLNISSIQTADGGLYKCIASSKVGSVEHAERLNVYGVPFIRPMDKRAIVSGETLFVTCPAAGYPIKSITWERGMFHFSEALALLSSDLKLIACKSGCTY